MGRGDTRLEAHSRAIYTSSALEKIGPSRSIALGSQFSQRLASLSEGDISAIIQMAWEDRTSFETIQQRTGWSEPEVIRLMRHELQPNSFRLWRKRMKGRVTKHRALRSPDIQYEDRRVADHRRANC